MRNDDFHEIVIDGPTRFSKTMFILDYIFNLCFEQENLRIAIVRANAVDHNETIRHDIVNSLLRYNLQDSRLKGIIECVGGRAFTELHVNSSNIILVGMNNPTKMLGSEFDIIFNSQVEQLKKDQYEVLITRCAGTAGNWIEDGRIRSQILSDANPDRKDHFLQLRKAKNQTKFISFGFQDNPLFYRNGDWTDIGLSYTQTLKQGLTGVNYDRYYKGEWASPEGAIFILKDEHIADILPWRRKHDHPEFDEYLDDPAKNKRYAYPPADQYNIFRMMDFGSTSPSVCLWLAEHKDTKDSIVFREWRQTGTDTLEMADHIKKHSVGRAKRTIIDNDNNIRRILAKKGIQASLAPKGSDSIKAGIDMIQEALRKTSEGLDGGLKIFRGLRCNRDPELHKRGLPLDLIAEMGAYVWEEDGDRPVKGNDHGIDPLRYYYLDRNQFGDRIKIANKVERKRQGWL